MSTLSSRLELGVPPPFDAAGMFVMDLCEHRRWAQQRVQRTWDGVHISPRICPTEGAKLCTYHCWFSLPKPVPEPYYELPLSRRSLRCLFWFRLSALALLIKQGRRGKNRVLRAMRLCPGCPGRHVGYERHLIVECSTFAQIRRAYVDICRDAHDTMRLFMWHKDQKGVSSCLLRLLSEHDELVR